MRSPKYPHAIPTQIPTQIPRRSRVRSPRSPRRSRVGPHEIPTQIPREIPAGCTQIPTTMRVRSAPPLRPTTFKRYDSNGAGDEELLRSISSVWLWVKSAMELVDDESAAEQGGTVTSTSSAAPRSGPGQRERSVACVVKTHACCVLLV